jgi:hypothetical protein
MNFNCNLNLKYIVALKLRNMSAGLYFFLEIFFLTFTTLLA